MTESEEFGAPCDTDVKFKFHLLRLNILLARALWNCIHDACGELIYNYFVHFNTWLNRQD